MADPVRMLLLEIEQECARLPGAALIRAEGGEARLDRFKQLAGRDACPGYAAFVRQYDGGQLSAPQAEKPGDLGSAEPGLRLLTFEESLRRTRGAERAELKGLWPIAERGPRLFALDYEVAPDGECPVVEVADHSVDRVGTSCLRFLYACLGEIAAGPQAVPLDLARDLCRRDPGLADHWVHLIDHLEDAKRAPEIDDVLVEALRCASPPGPALMIAVALRALDRGDLTRALAAIEDALGLEAMTARDDDARLDAAAISLVLAQERGDAGAAARARECLGAATASTGAYWRGEAMRSYVIEDERRAALATRVVEALVPGDTDTRRMRENRANLPTALRALSAARDALDRGAFDEAIRHAQAAAGERPDLGVCHAVLAESLNARRERGALEAAQRATTLNPVLVDAWREMGDAYLEARQASRAEEAFRKALECDPSFALGFAKLAQALLEQGRTRDALEAISAASDRGGDPFFAAAVKGDILAEMSRHHEAAESYDHALRLEPEDHWVLHQAAIEHSRAGNLERAAELFEQALCHDHDGCHQTLVDYGDLLRRMGRIGDAVRMYRKAVAANPNDPEWRRVLREAERELMAAPN